MRYFEIENDRSEGYTGSISGVHKWSLPGLLNCPGCKTTWSTSAQVCTERFVEAYQRLGLDGAVFSALPVHPVSA